MNIDWASIGIASAITVGAGVLMAVVVAAAVASFAAAADRIEVGRSAALPRLAGFTCLAVAVAAVLVGIILIVPAFH